MTPPSVGAGGMVVKPEPVAAAWEALDLARGHCIYLTADGEPFDQSLAEELSLEKQLVLLCGHYKGVDERARRFVDREVSIGDYVLTGGEPAALVLIDAVVRLIPGGSGQFLVCPVGLVPRGPSRLPMVYPAGGVPRRRGSPGSAQRKPRKSHGVAAPAVPAAHLRPPPRNPRQGRAGPGGTAVGRRVAAGIARSDSRGVAREEADRLNRICSPAGIFRKEQQDRHGHEHVARNHRIPDEDGSTRLRPRRHPQGPRARDRRGEGAHPRFSRGMSSNVAAGVSARPLPCAR